MKLYTEEQVKKMIEKSQYAGLTAEFLILTTPPLQLPSDEKIKKVLIQYNDYLFTFIDKDEIGINVETKDVIKWYNETYGEDNYSENLEQWAWDNPCLSRSDVYNLFEEVFKTKRLTFDKTYAIGASKEVSDFQNKLRKLAKDKSELLQKSI
jgi:hypothetical protein